MADNVVGGYSMVAESVDKLTAKIGELIELEKEQLDVLKDIRTRASEAVIMRAIGDDKYAVVTSDEKEQIYNIEITADRFPLKLWTRDISHVNDERSVNRAIWSR